MAEQRGTIVQASALVAPATVNYPDIDMNGMAALHLIVDVTVPNGGTVTVSVYGKDPASGKYYLLLASAAIATAVTTVLRIGLAETAAGNLAANDFIPRTVRVSAVVATAAVTFSIGLNGVG